MIDYKGIVEEMVDNHSIKLATSVEYNGRWYGIEIILYTVEEIKSKSQLPVNRG